MPEALTRSAWFAVGAALALPLGLLWGSAVGRHDADLAAAHDRRTAAAQCTDGELAVLIMRDAGDPARDLWTCSGGSLRRAAK